MNSIKCKHCGDPVDEKCYVCGDKLKEQCEDCHRELTHGQIRHGSVHVCGNESGVQLADRQYHGEGDECGIELYGDAESSAEWHEYNTFSAYMGEMTPIYVTEVN